MTFGVGETLFLEIGGFSANSARKNTGRWRAKSFSVGQLGVGGAFENSRFCARVGGGDLPQRSLRTRRLLRMDTDTYGTSSHELRRIFDREMGDESLD